MVRQPHLNWQVVPARVIRAKGKWRNTWLVHVCLPGRCTDHTGLTWHWMDDQARCRWPEPSLSPYLNVYYVYDWGGKMMAPRPESDLIHYYQKDRRHLRTTQHWMFYPVCMLMPWSTRAHILCLMCTIHQASKWKQDLNEAREFNSKWQTRIKFHQIGAIPCDIMIIRQTSSTFWLTSLLKWLCQI